MWRPVLVMIAIAACGSGAPERAWVDLAPLPLQIRLPVGGHAAPLEALVEGKPPTMMVSARGCVVVVTPSDTMDVGAFQASIKRQRPTATFTRVRAPETGSAQILVDFESRQDGRPGKQASFALHAVLGGAGWTCEPFAWRAELACEAAACRSLRAR